MGLPAGGATVSLRQLQYLVAVAELKGFRRAADACGVSQPALSAQVALAERQLGVQVFERDRRTMRVSPAGQQVLDQAQRVLVAARELEELTKRLADPLSGTLRLGVIPTIGPYLLPEITPGLARAFPALTLTWTERKTHELVRELKEGTLDGLIVALETNLGDVEQVALGVDPFVLAAAPRHPLLVGKRPASPDILDGASVLLLDDGHCFRDQALRVCAQKGAAEQSFRATSLGTLVQMVSASQSVTLLPSLALGVENRRSQLRIRRFASPEPGRTLALVWRRGSPLAATMRAIADIITPAIAQLVSGKNPAKAGSHNRATLRNKTAAVVGSGFSRTETNPAEAGFPNRSISRSVRRRSRE